MRAFETYQQCLQNSFEVEHESIKQEEISSEMHSYTPYQSFPYMYNELSSAYLHGEQNLSFDMLKDVEQHSNQFASYESDIPSSLHSSASAASIPSANSSTTGSPYMAHAQLMSLQLMHPDSDYINGAPAVFDDTFGHSYDMVHIYNEAMFDQEAKPLPPYVDPIMVSGQRNGQMHKTECNSYSQHHQQQYQNQPYSTAPSPAPSSHSHHSFTQPVTSRSYGARPTVVRQQSVSSDQSVSSPRSHSGDETREKGRCPYPDCGRVYKDLKAHMLTHENERPEKCPIPSCEYYKKGFARKYDRNRHVLTHYRGTMICGFCPGSGTAAEKSFNRADVFKRHLTTVHDVEQAPPNSRKRSPSKAIPKLSSYCLDATGKCSICNTSFSNAQDFYEHLDDCVLKVVQQEDPSEAINAARLGALMNDSEVQAIFERNHIKAEESAQGLEEEDEDDEEDDEDDEEYMHPDERSGRGVIRTAKASSNRPIIGGNISKKLLKRGLTWSRNGGSIIGKSRKRRKFYPPSWGMATDKMNMRKRVLCVYDGQRRLLKDDMMMHNEFEVRIPLGASNDYVTDLDIETMKRAEAFNNATVEERGPWIQEPSFFADAWA